MDVILSLNLLNELKSVSRRQHIALQTGNCMLQSKIGIDTSVPSVIACTTRPSRPLWSSLAPSLPVPRTRTVFASRAFSVAAPTVWNSLADNVVNSDTLATFKKRLKTHVKRSCHRAPLHFLSRRYTSFMTAMYSER